MCFVPVRVCVCVCVCVGVFCCSGSTELMNVSPSDYETLRIGGLVLAGIIVVMSVFLLAGESYFNIYI